MTITKDMLLGDILREKPESADTLLHGTWT